MRRIVEVIPIAADPGGVLAAVDDQDGVVHQQPAQPVHRLTHGLDLVAQDAGRRPFRTKHQAFDHRLPSWPFAAPSRASYCRVTRYGIQGAAAFGDGHATALGTY